MIRTKILMSVQGKALTKSTDQVKEERHIHFSPPALALITTNTNEVAINLEHAMNNTVEGMREH